MYRSCVYMQLILYFVVAWRRQQFCCCFCSNRCQIVVFSRTFFPLGKQRVTRKYNIINKEYLHRVPAFYSQLASQLQYSYYCITLGVDQLARYIYLQTQLDIVVTVAQSLRYIESDLVSHCHSDYPNMEFLETACTCSSMYSFYLLYIFSLRQEVARYIIRSQLLTS